MIIKGDSSEYHLLTKHIGKLKIDKATLTCEIGLREGLGSKIIMDSIRDQNPPFYKHVAVDPYNNLYYQHCDDEEQTTADYTEDMKQRIVSYLYQNYQEFDFYHMTDEYYFETMGKGHQFSINGNCMLFGLYKVAHLDGPHTTHAVLDELKFFIPRMDEESLIIIDDYKHIKMGIVDMLLKTYNFNVAEEGDNKIIYKKE